MFRMVNSNGYDLSIRNIIIFVLYSGVLIVMFVLLAKPQIRRMKLRYDKNFNTTSAKSFLKSYREDFNDKIEKVNNICFFGPFGVAYKDGPENIFCCISGRARKFGTALIGRARQKQKDKSGRATHISDPSLYAPPVILFLGD